MQISKMPLEGSIVSANPLPGRIDHPLVNLRGTYREQPGMFSMDESMLSKHTLLVGGTGCGKTTLFYHFVEQIQRNMTDEDVMVIFDSKGDFYSKFYRPGQYVIGNSRQYRDKSLKWNIFKEIVADGWNEQDYMLNCSEICRSLFAEKLEKSKDVFFPNAAREVLQSLLICLLREAKKDKSVLQDLYNSSFRKLIDESDATMLQGIMNTYPDMASISTYIDGANGQTQGVLSEMYSVLRDVLIGVFADKGGFSMRNFIRSKGKKVLYIEYDLSIGSVLTPVYRILFDLALKEALGRQKCQGNVYLFCDEFKLLPNLQHIDDGVNFGRSLGVKIFAGLQSIEQLYEIYKESRGKNIAAGFSNIFAFRANDITSRDYVKNLFGRNIILERYVSSGAQYVEEKREGQVVEDWDMSQLRVGEAIVCLAFSKPFIFRFALHS